MTYANEAHRWTDHLDDLCTRIALASAASAHLSRFARRRLSVGKDNSLKRFHGHGAGEQPINLPRLNGQGWLVRFQPP
jgi:hypothetical protein